MSAIDQGVREESTNQIDALPNSTSIQSTNNKVQFQPRTCPRLPASETISTLPPEFATDVLGDIQRRVTSASLRKLVVLDDDPTGTQTCHGIPVLTTWAVDVLKEELGSKDPGFFILTNSRAFNPDQARTLLNEVFANIDTAAKAVGARYEIVLRSDSTLRGHFALEVNVATASLGELDGLVVAPFFYPGGRYTLDDIHYVLESEDLVPAAQTQFAQDKTFGYKSSHLRDFVREKMGSEPHFLSITIDDIRRGGPEKVASKLDTAQDQTVIIVNAAAVSDMHVFCAGLLRAIQGGKRFLYRTGAEFVSSRLGIQQIEPLVPLKVDPEYSTRTTGGLIVAGSYVPKTTQQLDMLRSGRGLLLETVEIDVESLLASDQKAVDLLIETAAQTTDEHLSSGKDVLVMSSRQLISGNDAESSLSIGSIVASVLVRIARSITVRPRYVIAKGGITSSDVASKVLNIKKALIVGQSIPGSPLWRSDEPSTKWPGIPFIVFPGNVGGPSALEAVVAAWSLPSSSA